MEEKSTRKGKAFPLRLPDNVHRELKEISETTGTSMTNIFIFGGLTYGRELLRRNKKLIPIIHKTKDRYTNK